jgi:hypothetical protein
VLFVVALFVVLNLQQGIYKKFQLNVDALGIATKGLEKVS